MDRRSVLTCAGASASLLAFTALTATPATALQVPQSKMSAEQQYSLIIKKLDSVPARLKNADPKSYPNYQAEIAKYLGNTTTITSAPRGVNASFDFIGCGIALIGLVKEFKHPLIKILGWLRKAKEIWGSVKEIWNAIKSGKAIKEIGAEAAKFIGGVLGFKDVAKKCLA
ncbi:MAG: hypothetical protein Q4C74_08680 [Rothia sp. (in: high G+C Gram-positive bacteria)]|nr:hypothetical protein [Rothia sp. (in: high G+C Gram-positive bacteria)]